MGETVAVGDSVGVPAGGLVAVWVGVRLGSGVSVAVEVREGVGVRVEEEEAVGRRAVVPVEISGSNAASVGVSRSSPASRLHETHAIIRSMIENRFNQIRRNRIYSTSGWEIFNMTVLNL